MRSPSGPFIRRHEIVAIILLAVAAGAFAALHLAY